MKIPRRTSSAAIVFISGCAHAASVAWPFNLFFEHGQALWVLQLLALAALVTQLWRATSVRQAAWLGWLFATAWLCSTLWWLFISLHHYGHLPSVPAALAVFVLGGLLALYYAAACAAFAALTSAQTRGAALVFAALWTVAELIRGFLFTGLPWGSSGYAHVDGPLAAYASWIGVQGIGMLAAGAAVVLAALVGRPGYGAIIAKDHLLQCAGVALVFLAPLFVPLTGHSTSAGVFSATLLQGNIAQDEKFEQRRGIAPALAWYRLQLQSAQTTLIVTPETAVPLLYQQMPENYWPALRPGQAALIGVPWVDASQGYTNAVVARTASSTTYRYDKHHLVPFGEFTPPFARWFTERLQIPFGDFKRGALQQASFVWGGQRLAPNICYEDLFGAELAARFLDPTSAPTAFVNVSNIAWFGNTIAIDQHLNISRMRALEFERPMLRATNTGATAIIDHQGRVVDSLPRLTQGALAGHVEGRNGLTPYAWWVSRWGLWPLWVLTLAIVLVAVWARYKRTRG